MNTKKVKAVIFDMDGTLIDTEKYYRMFWPKALAHFGYEMTDEQALTMRSLGQPYAPQHLKEMFHDPDLDYIAIRNYRKQIMGEYLEKNGIEIKKGVIELLDYLKAQGIHRAIATATDQLRTEQYLKQLGLYDYFDKIICATMVEHGKPSPDIYQYACRQLELSPEECIAVEDSPNGVCSAYDAGCNVVMVPDQTEPDEALREKLAAVVDSLDEIIKLFKKFPGLTKEDEEQQLRKIIGITQDNLEHAKADIRKINEDLADLLEVYDAKDKEGLALWNNATARLKEDERELVRYEKARKKPYFGRIDFRDPKAKSDEAYYIGRVGITDGNSDPVVLDWRAPIASVYYESNMGPCQYTVSSEGTFEIDLKRKRTYEIENDRLKDFFDSDVVANDELLTKYLAKNKKAVLGEIIATIQKEQNIIIRRSPKTNIIVQGVAGSGKTTVAMHRISYILYNYKDDFRPEDFYIIGSNRILLNYITSVLPELDVYGIRQMTMEQLFIRLLYEDWDETKYFYHSIDKTDVKNSIKGSLAWFLDLEKFCQKYEDQSVAKEDIYMEKTGNLLLSREQIERYLKSDPKVSMQSKMLMLNEILYAKYENEVSGKSVTFPPKEKKILDKKYASYFGDGKWRESVFDFYREFLFSQREAGKEADVPENSFDVYDLAALAYIYKRIKETDPVREASHVVIDEAQDFGMMAYKCLHYCLYGCTYTIMGDTSQNIHFEYGLNDWDELKKLILTGTFDAFGLLRKSYRNTVEISEFANEILRHGDFSIYPVEPIIRHGNPVQTVACPDENKLLADTVTTIKKWQRDGYETIAVICRDEAEAGQVAEDLKKYVTIVETDLEKAEFGDGVMVLPVSYTKGLEFDAVLLFDPTQEKYPSGNGHVKLLYVAATRALHELVVLYQGKLTGILADKVPEGKHMKEFAAETLTKAAEFEKVQHTTKELEQQRRVEGAKDMAEREYIGPKRIVIEPRRKENETEQTIPNVIAKRDAGQTRNSAAVKQYQKPERAKMSMPAGQKEEIIISPYEFGTIPDNAILRVKGHSRNNFSIKWIKKTKSYVELSSMYGLLRITPITPEVIRVSFVKGVTEKIGNTAWKGKADTVFPWSARESKTVVEIATEKVTVRIAKNNGAVCFYNEKKQLLLAEKAEEPRLQEETCNWTFFDWEKSEHLKAKGLLATDFMDVTAKAKYISYGGKRLRMPLVLSEKGYGIAVASKGTVLFCGIRTFGPYIMAEGIQSDYYFISEKNREKMVEIYQKTLTLQPKF